MRRSCLSCEQSIISFSWSTWLVAFSASRFRQLVMHRRVEWVHDGLARKRGRQRERERVREAGGLDGREGGENRGEEGGETSIHEKLTSLDKETC